MGATLSHSARQIRSAAAIVAAGLPIPRYPLAANLSSGLALVQADLADSPTCQEPNLLGTTVCGLSVVLEWEYGSFFAAAVIAQ